MLNNFHSVNQFKKNYRSPGYGITEKEREMNEKLSRIEESYVDAAIRKANRNPISQKRFRPIS